MTDRTRGRAGPEPAGGPVRPVGRTAEFESIYRANVGAITGYFARRTANPQLAADLTAETFVAAITGFAGYDPHRGSARGWLFGIARKVFARHWDTVRRDESATARCGGRRLLDADEAAELIVRIDAERAARTFLAALDDLPAIEREVVDLVDLGGLTPREAAEAIGVSAGTLRIRLFRARTKLRRLIDGEDRDDA